MDIKQHQTEVKKLGELEQHLIELISRTNNELLRDKFLEWQKQRAICNKGFSKLVESISKKDS